MVFLTAAFFSLQAESTELFENWISARALGMGNAYSAVVDNKDAVFYNPAALDKIRGLHLTVMDPAIGTDAYDAYSTYTDVTGSNYSSVIHKFFGKQVWVGVFDSLAYSMRGFAIVGFDKFDLSFNLHDPAYANLNFNTTNDVGFQTGVGFSLIPDDILRLGVSVKRVTRYGGRVSFGPSTLATMSNAQLTNLINNVGTGYGLDSGILLEMPLPSHPSISAVWHDIGQTKFTPASGSNAPPPMDNEAVIGFGMLLDLTVLKIRPALDFKHINLTDEQLGKRMHLGVELEFPGFSVRAGANQGYLAAGVGVDLKYLKIDAAMYGVELDTYPGQLMDQRYILQLTVDLNFDPSFDFGSGSSSTTRAFQRR